MQVSSGTVLEIASRIFVATAAHVIPSNPEGRLWLLPDQPRSSREGRLGFESFGRHPDYDVGFLELTPSAMREQLPRIIPSSLQAIRLLNSGSTSSLSTLVGNPVQFIRSEHFRNEPAIGLRVIAFTTIVRAVEDWPTPPSGNRPADQGVDVFFDYPNQGTERVDTGEELTLTSPEGFSGGGLWDGTMRPGEVWSANSVALFAVQSSWNEVERYARATQIIHWLNLIRSQIPELQSVLEQQFPELTDMQLVQ